MLYIENKIPNAFLVYFCDLKKIKINSKNYT